MWYIKFNMEKEYKTIPHIDSSQKVILFDGSCKLCNAWCNLVIRYDKGNVIKLLSMQSDKGQSVLQHLGKPTNNFETMLFIDNNRVSGKSTAFFNIIQHLSFPIKSLVFLKYLPIAIRDYIYDLIAKNRYILFGKYEQCPLPNKEHEDRYL